ncbi:MAG TPA: iron-sulfur cluster repair di-iron protein [Bryobacteraceae bacterium]|nr:iron-sulfur cluster repair di-iron protein [Bryobacteraceae bacterium]HPT26720.1 iron-sulfur cluster repair di-iron protein [Bryobacteraceae bacterium]
MTTTSSTLADVAALSLGAVRTLERYGLDYCCGGKRPFDEACLSKGLNPEAVLGEVERAQGAGAQDRDWQTERLDVLVNHIVGTHHEYLKLELPALANRLAKVHSVHGPRDPEMLNRMVGVFGSLLAEMELHMHKEEAILFPFIEQYGRAETEGAPMPPVPFGSIANPIGVMESEHANAGDALGELRAMTKNYELPAYACTTVRTLYEGLQALEADLHVHIHLENNILFPRAIALEGGSASPVAR